LAKKYTSISLLQKDNNNTDVYFDKLYDDTPYKLLDKYKQERKTKTPEHFFEYLQEVLISKHDCPPSLAPGLAKTLVEGKRKVEEGQFAVVIIRPNPSPEIDVSQLSSKEREEIDHEAELRTRTQYYKRVGDNWIQDTSVSEETFLDTNKLFCNIDAGCNYTNAMTDVGEKCVPNSIAELRLRNASQKRLLQELDNRYDMSVEEIEKHLGDTIVFLRRQIRNGLLFRETMQHKQNNICFALGQQLLRPNEEILLSPHLRLRDLILSQVDFIKKQSDIVRFVELFTREPMKSLNEEDTWRYCKQTNTKLFPMAHYDLAKTFLYVPDKYMTRLDIICREYGKKEDNVIVDKSSGWVLKYLDLEQEEEYDEAGFKIKTHDIMEASLESIIMEAVSKKDKVFDNPDTQKVYNIFLTLSTNLGIKKDAIEGGLEDYVLRVSLELINNKNAVVILSEESYQKRLEKEKEKQRKTTPPPYEMYRDELIIIIVSESYCKTNKYN
jgi:hypothetical protein